MMNKKLSACILVLLIICAVVNARSRPQSLKIEERDIEERDISERDADPGWIRRQLVKAGEAASRLGGNMGGFALKLTNAVDRICGIIKKVIPIVGAVCTVGQFQFCALDNVTGGVDPSFAAPGAAPAAAVNTINLDEQD